MLRELYDFEIRVSDIETQKAECESCGGVGVIDIGDCEDGVWEECPQCGGVGYEDLEAFIR